METPIRQERFQLIDRVLHLDPETYLFGGVVANVDLIFQHIEQDYTRVDWMKWDVQNIHSATTKQAALGALIQNPRYIQAFATVFSDQQFARKSGLGANESMIFQELVNRDLPCTAENVSQVVIDLWDQLADNSQYRDDKAASDRRQKMIDELTQGGTKGFTVQIANRKVAYTKEGKAFDAMAGQSQGSFSMALKGPWSRGTDSSSFDQMSDEQIAELYEQWRTTRDLTNLSVEDLRKLVKSNGPTDVFNKNVRVPSAVAPDGDVLIENPATPGKEFTKRDLIQYINAAPYNGRNLITRNGRIVPKLRQRFEEILNGLRG